MTQGQLFKHSLTDLKSVFSFSSISCYTKVKEPYYLPVAGRRRVGCKPFSKVLSGFELGLPCPSPVNIFIPVYKYMSISANT